MRLLTPLMISSALLLSACGDSSKNEQAEHSRPPRSDQTAQAPAPAAPRPGQPSDRPTQPPALPNAGPETTGSVIRPATPSATPQTPAQPAAAPDRIAPAFSGRTFTSNGTWIQFSSDNRFTMRDNATERVVRGRYALEGDRLTFSEPQGETGQMRFPLTCRVRQSSPTEFTLEATDGACAMFGGQTFQAQG